MQSTKGNSIENGYDSVVSLTNKLKAQSNQSCLSDRICLIGKYAIDWTDVQRHIHRDPFRYHREIVETNDEFQLLILTWLPGQISPIHNHRGSQCVVRVLSGTAIETVFYPCADQSFSRKASTHVQGTVFGGEDADIHTLGNSKTAKRDLVTMHVYFPPLKQMDLFDVRNRRLVQTA